MKKLVKILFLMSLLNTQNSVVNAQNLVPNPSFEDTVYCPLGLSNIEASQNWLSCSYSPDYFNMCSSGNVDVPSNFFGYQQPFHGNSYAGIYCYDPVGNYREYIGIQLSQQLASGIEYFVSAYISRSDFHFIASDKFGFRFTNNLYSVSNPTPTDNFANVFSTTIINDSINWIKVEGSFIADSNYIYLVLGNFFDSLNTNTINYSSSDASYYYVDAVCVSQDSLTCSIFNNVESIPKSNISIFPNPTSGVINISHTTLIESVSVFSSDQKIVIKSAPNKTKTSFNLTFYPSGIYFVHITTNQYTFIKKILLY